MKRNFKVWICVMIVLLLCGCGQPGSGGGNIPPEEIIEGRFTADEDKIAVFSNGTPQGFWARNDRGNGHPFNCSFQNANAVIDDGVLTLWLTKVQSDRGYAGAPHRP